MKNLPNSKHSNESGFSIVELIIAMVLFLIIIGTIYGLLQVGLIDRNRASRRSDMLKNARAAIHLIGRDALNAGLSYNRSGAVVPDDFVANRLGLPTDSNADRDVLPSVIGGNNLFANILNQDTNVRTDLISFSYRDTAFNGTNVISLTNASAATGSPEIVRLQTQPNDARNSQPFDLYLVESDSSQVAVMATGRPSLSQIDIAPGDPLGINQSLNGVGTDVSILQKCTDIITENCTTYVASVKRFFWVAYKVKPDGTLVRMLFGNNTGVGADQQIQELPIAYNIEDFQIRYVLEDGTVWENPSVGTDGIAGTDDDVPSNFNLVRQINVTIEVQATEDDEQFGRPDSITLNATFSTRNLQYDAG
jgi:type II secretory pathway pseudopilin PulG